jgi:hypothetical protein
LQVYIEGLRSADEPIVDRLRLEIFLDDVFHNYRSLLDIHTDLLEKLHARQEEQHPRIGAISDLIYDAALRWQDAIIEYGSHYPKAKYAWELEKRTNPKFAAFLDVSLGSDGILRLRAYCGFHLVALPEHVWHQSTRYRSFRLPTSAPLTAIHIATQRYTETSLTVGAVGQP